MPRIMTYNVHRCIGTDGVLSPERIAEVIAASEPDIVALQELDVGRERTGGVDQAMEIACDLEMELHFHPAFKVLEEAYGDAILTAAPLRLVKAGALPGWRRLPGLEPRGAIWAEIDLGGARLHVLNTHLGLLGRERRAQVAALLGPDWLGSARLDDDSPVILLGDFNLLPFSGSYRRLSARLGDAQRAPGIERRKPTYPARRPTLRIDHVFVNRSVAVSAVEVPRDAIARVASDHLPLVVDFELAPAAQRAVPLQRTEALE